MENWQDSLRIKLVLQFIDEEDRWYRQISTSLTIINIKISPTLQRSVIADNKTKLNTVHNSVVGLDSLGDFYDFIF